jgi:hypothetical protein
MTAAEGAGRPLAPSAVLDSLVAEARAYSAEFPYVLANHLPMCLVALQRLGGNDRRLPQFFANYRDYSGLVKLPAAKSAIDPARWADHLGDRGREADYRAFFAEAVRRDGVAAALHHYLPTLLPGIGASALHALMRLAYALLRSDGDEVGAALGYWAATFLPLGQPTGAAAITDDPAEVLSRMREVEAFRHVHAETDLLWHNMRACAQLPEFAPVVDWLAIGEDGLARVAAASLVLYTATLDFCALHALTGAHWVRVLWPYVPQPKMALRHFWQAIASVYPKFGMPALPNAARVARWRALPCPDWTEIRAAAAASNDEHDISLVFSASEEHRHYGDRLYQVAAAARLGLVPPPQ